MNDNEKDSREVNDWVDVVVVTEDSAFGSLLTYGFTASGHSCRVVAAGPDASREIEARAPKAIVLDLFMAVNDGFKLLHWLGAQGVEAIPTLVLTTSAERTMTVEIMVAGADDVFVKPVTFPAVLERVRELMSETTTAHDARIAQEKR